jgi:hypothetical protein
VPPGGWTYTQPETGAVFRAMSWSRLLKLVRIHREANKLDTTPGWEERFESEICMERPELGNDRPRVKNGGAKVPGWSAILRFTKTMWEWSKSGKLEKPEESERRAAICAMCPENQYVGGCYGCTGVIRYTAEVLLDRTTSHDSSLNVCVACGCYLKLKVHVPNDVLDVAEEGSITYPDHCWRIKK